MEIDHLAFFWLRCLLALFFVTGTLYVASGLSHRLLGNDRMSARWCGTIVSGLWLASAGFHFLATLGLFQVWVAVAALGCLVVIVRLGGYSPAMLWSSLRQDALALKDFVLCETSPWQKKLLLILLIGALLLAARTSLLPPLGWDSLTYHAVKAGMWVQNGHAWLMDSPGGWHNYRSFPGGSELLLAWSMLPFHSDYAACVVDFVLWLCLIPTLILLGSGMGLNRKSSLIGGLYCAFIPAVFLGVGSCYSDLALASTILLGAAFASLFCLHVKTGYLVLSMVSLGLAGGIKYVSFIPIGGVLVIVALHILISRQVNFSIVGAFAVGLVLMIAAMVPWPIHNLHMTGYPLFPFSFNIAGMQLGVSSPVTDWFLDRPEVRPYDLRLEFIALKMLFQGPGVSTAWNSPNFGPLALVPLAVLPVAFVGLIRRRPWTALVVAAEFSGVLWFYYLPDFTVVRQLFAWSNARFLLAAFFPAAMMSVMAFPERLKELFLNVLLVSACLHLAIGLCLHWQPYELPYIASVTAFVALGAAAICYRIRKWRRIAYAMTIALVVLAGMTGLQWSRDQLRWVASKQSFFFHDFPRYWVDAAKRVDEPPIAHRIAVTSGPVKHVDNWCMYMFMGRLLQNTLLYIPLTESGEILLFGPKADNVGSINLTSWLACVHSEGVTHVMSFWPPSIEIRWMQEHPEIFERITGAGPYALYRVRTDQRKASRSSN